MFDGTDVKMAGQRVELLDSANNLVKWTTTAADGSYKFTDLAGSAPGVAYKVLFPTVAHKTIAASGADNQASAVDNKASVTINVTAEATRLQTASAGYKNTLYNVTYAYTGTVPAGAPEPPATLGYAYGAAVTVEAAPSLGGYTFSGWNTTDATVSGGTFTMPDKTVAFTGYWTEATGTAYKVEHYQQDLGASTYSIVTADTQSLTGTTGATAAYSAKTYTGFVANTSKTTWQDSTNAASTTERTIAANGSLVIRLYYDRQSYSVSYAYTGTVPPGAPNPPTTNSYEYGETVTVKTEPTMEGFTFSGWSTTDAAVSGGTFTMPGKKVAFTGSWAANTGTAYKVEHYQQDLNASTYSIVSADKENKTGTTGATAAYTAKTYTGFAVNTSKTTWQDSANAASTMVRTIAGDGSLVIKLYYDRQSYGVSYAYTGTVPTGVPTLPITVSKEFGATVAVATDPSLVGYTFSGWSTSDATVSGGSFTMPGKTVAFTGSWTANTNTAYKVEHYKQDLGASTYSIVTADTENQTGTTGTDADYSAKTYAGFAYNSAKTTWQTNANPASVTKRSIAGDGSLIIRLYYDRQSYAVSYAYTGPVPAGAPGVPGTVSKEFGAAVTVETEPTLGGFTFSGWSTADATVASGSFTMPGKAVAFTGSWTANGDTAYKVEHYQKDVGAATYTKADTQTLSGTTSDTAAYTPKSYAGFTYNSAKTTWETSANAASATARTIAADGSLVIKLYYDRQSYNVSYSYTGTVPPGTANAPGTAGKEFGAEVAVAANPTLQGYTFSGWSTSDATVSSGSFTMPAGTVAFTGSWTANANTAYKVEHYQKDVGAATYSIVTADTQNLSGTTAAAAAYAAKSYAGFTNNSAKTTWQTSAYAASATERTVAADGSLVIRLYYDRLSYNVSYAYTGAVPSSAAAEPADASKEFGAAVAVAAAPTLQGYTFSGWSTSDATVASGSFQMPAGTVAFTGSWTANTNTAYKVEHYRQDLGAATYSIVSADTQNPTGTTATAAAFDAKTYAGFLYDSTKTTWQTSAEAASTATKMIAADGSLTIRLYYNRQSYNVGYAYTGTVPAGAPQVPAAVGKEFGETVAVAAAPTLMGYNFSGWGTSDAAVNAGSFQMPANAVTFAGSWAAKTGFTVNYDTDGGSPAAIAPLENVSWTQKNLLPEQPRKAGFVFGGWTVVAGGSGSPDENMTYGELASGDGAGTSINLKAVWTSKGNYAVSYDTNGGTPGISMKSGVKWTDANLLPDASGVKKAGYTFKQWDVSQGNTARKNVKAADDYGKLAANDTDSGITLQMQWTENSDYVVHYDMNGATSGAIKDLTGVKWTQASLLPAKPSKTDAVFAGWNVTVGGTKANVLAGDAYKDLVQNDAVKEITLQAQWNNVYTVRFYTNNVGTELHATAKVTQPETKIAAGDYPANPAKAHYTFGGWYTQPNGKGTKVDEDTAVLRLSYWPFCLLVQPLWLLTFSKVWTRLRP